MQKRVPKVFFDNLIFLKIVLNLHAVSETMRSGEETSVPEKSYRVAFLGGAQVGKTSIIDQVQHFQKYLTKFPESSLIQ